MKLSKLNEGLSRVLANFDKLKIPDTMHLDMSEREFLTFDRTKCKTVMCHGGWYAVAKELHLQKNEDSCDKMDYTNGAEAMAKDMGFENEIEMLLFFDQRPDLWGNYFGQFMFGSALAFANKNQNQAYTLHDIIEHWRSVKARIEEKEVENETK